MGSSLSSPFQKYFLARAQQQPDENEEEAQPEHCCNDVRVVLTRQLKRPTSNRPCSFPWTSTFAHLPFPTIKCVWNEETVHINGHNSNGAVNDRLAIHRLHKHSTGFTQGGMQYFTGAEVYNTGRGIAEHCAGFSVRGRGPG